jgi:hypothetical protein
MSGASRAWRTAIVLLGILMLGTVASCSSHSTLTATASTTTTTTTTFLPPLPTTPQAPGASADQACSQIMFGLWSDWQNLTTQGSSWRSYVDRDIARLPSVAAAFTQWSNTEPTPWRKLASEANALIAALQRHDNTQAATILKQLNDDCWAAPIHLR